jgi:glycosyltransferase involved in cell wall biosynthesis
LLLVDDGSSDGSTEIARSYVRLRPDKIRLLEHEGHQNKGMSATRNLGISRANGEYIGFLDADDIWLPDKLAEQIAVFKKHPECGMVYGRTQIWHSWTENPEDKNKDHFYPLGVTANSVIYPPKITLLLLENKAQSPTTCNALFNRNVFEKAGFFLEDFKGMFEDAAFFCKAGLFVHTYVSDKVWAKYRQHNESCSVISAGSNEDEKARYKFLKWFEGYLNSKKIFSLKVRLTLYKKLIIYIHKY